MNVLIPALAALVLPPANSYLFGWVIRRLGRPLAFTAGPFALGAWIGSCFGNALGSTVTSNWAAVAVDVASTAFALWLWWWHRRKRRNALAFIGAKSKALRDALVRRMRQSAKPRPVLRPVPQGSP